MPHYIGGTWTDGAGESFESRSPATGERIGTFEHATADEVDRAVAAAAAAERSWSDRSHVERAEFLWDVHAALIERTDELGRLVSRECGKEIDEGRADVVEAAHMAEWAAGNARHPHGDVVPSEIPERDAYMRRQPRGVTGCITPWNFPIAIPIWHVAIALVEGNPIVWKPAEQTPECGRVLTELFDDAGIPDGVFNLVQGAGDTGASIVKDDRVDTLLFTGSAEVGSEIQRTAAASPDKRAACEMGGKNALVATEHANIDIAVRSAIVSSFKTTGQRCVSTERLIVHDAIYEEFRDRFVSLAERIRIGDPLDDDTFMGPLVEAGQVERFHRYNDLAREEGAEVLLDRAELDDPPTDEGHWVGPFVYEMDYDDGTKRVLNEEVFAPHVALIRYDGGIERAVEIHDDTPYGLTGSIISEDYRELNYYRDHADAGLAYANLPCIGAEVQLPFGGIKRSGNGRPSAREIIEAVTDRTAWTVNNDTDISLAQGLSPDVEES